MMLTATCPSAAAHQQAQTHEAFMIDPTVVMCDVALHADVGDVAAQVQRMTPASWHSRRSHEHSVLWVTA